MTSPKELLSLAEKAIANPCISARLDLGREAESIKSLILALERAEESLRGSNNMRDALGEIIDPLQERAEQAEAASAVLVEALTFYADPDTWFSTTLLCDRPSGPIEEDYSDTEGWEDCASMRLGKKARQVLTAMKSEPYEAATSHLERVRRLEVALAVLVEKAKKVIAEWDQPFETLEEPDTLKTDEAITELLTAITDLPTHTTAHLERVRKLEANQRTPGTVEVCRLCNGHSFHTYCPRPSDGSVEPCPLSGFANRRGPPGQQKEAT